MLRLINIEKTSDTIRAEYIPEDSEEIGNLEISQKDYDDYDIIKSNKTSYDEPVGVYLRQAASALRNMLKESELPKTRLVMWH